MHDHARSVQPLSQAYLTQSTHTADISVAALLPGLGLVEGFRPRFHRIKKAPVSPTPRVSMECISLSTYVYDNIITGSYCTLCTLFSKMDNCAMFSFVNAADRVMHQISNLIS